MRIDLLVHGRFVLAVLLGFGLGTTSLAADLPKDAMPTTSASADPHAWLEDVNGAKPLQWVHSQNARTDAELAGTAGFVEREAELRAILDSEARIPEVEKIGANLRKPHLLKKVWDYHHAKL